MSSRWEDLYKATMLKINMDNARSVCEEDERYTWNPLHNRLQKWAKWARKEFPDRFTEGEDL